MLGVEKRAAEDFMAQRPETAIGEAVVVAFLLFPTQPDAAEGVAGIIGGHADSARLVAHFPIGFAGTVRHPDSAAGLHHGV